MLLTDKMIRNLCVQAPFMINPFSEGTRGGGVISYGLSHCGYDIRLADKLLVFKNTYAGLPINPKLFHDQEYRNKMFDEVEPAYSLQGRYYTIPPNGHALGMSVEKFNIPTNIMGQCLGKSTLARCGLIINVTPLEPGWKGILTLEIENHSPCPAVIYAGEGIAQVIFHQLAEPVETSYAEKGGIYQNQTEVTVARVRE